MSNQDRNYVKLIEGERQGTWYRYQIGMTGYFFECSTPAGIVIEVPTPDSMGREYVQLGIQIEPDTRLPYQD